MAERTSGTRPRPEGTGRGLYKSIGKRLFDLAMVTISAPFWLPLCCLLALVVRVGIGRPVLFRQRRPGLAGEPFTLLKFRSMKDARDGDGTLLPDSDRITRFGRLLRSTSLDELPELINVLKGDMSLVGPRPLLMQYLERYTPEQARRHEMRPGITGWAQINGRNAVSWEEKFEMDVWYVDHCTLRRDAGILRTTVLQALRREGITAEGHATMPEFRGTRTDE